MTHGRFDQHLQADEIAAFVDGTVTGDARTAIQAHLAACGECRAEVAEVSRIIRTLPNARGVSWRIWVPAAAAAALVLLWVAPREVRGPITPEHREEAVTVTVAPRPTAPVGTVASVMGFIWSSVPNADRYRVRLFDAEGTVIWEHETGDTAVALAGSVTLRAQRSYYWKVEAHTGFDRWAASDLIEFLPRRGGNP